MALATAYTTGDGRAKERRDAVVHFLADGRGQGYCCSMR